jgi:hypothetical protein
MKLVSKLKLTDIAGGVSDVSHNKGFAYLGKFNPTCTNQGGTGSGVEIVNIKKPRNPRSVGFIRAGLNSYVSEGVHAISLNTRKFKGDILLHSNEPCDGATAPAGGISAYDVTNPRNPTQLFDQFGDTDANDPEDPTPLEAPNSTHSVFGWQDGKKAYAVAVDNLEFLDVDIFDITNPRNPRLIRETGYDDWVGQVSPQIAFGESFFNHDMTVKKIGGSWFMLVSYWDVGQVLLNVDDPANPVFITDSDYADEDPEFPGFTPEGNAHQADWSANNKFIIGTDEDFSPFRARFEITQGPNMGDYPAGEFGWTVPIAEEYEDDRINGPTVFGGTGCPPTPDNPDTPEDESDPGTLTDIPPAASLNAGPGEEKILVLLRGACFFSHKVEAAQNAGYDAAIIANSHSGAANGDAPDSILCGSQGHEFEVTINAACIGHRAFHLLFDTEPGFDDTEEAVEPGDLGRNVTITTVFDGWGYVHLYDAETLEEIDTYAVAESKDPALASVFPLSVHEVKTDDRKGKNLGYISYYQAGARVIKFGPSGITEVGHFIGKGGNEFWGTFPVKRGKKRPLLLFSDRDFGLYILKYTGPQ